MLLWHGQKADPARSPLRERRLVFRVRDFGKADKLRVEAWMTEELDSGHVPPWLLECISSPSLRGTVFESIYIPTRQDLELLVAGMLNQEKVRQIVKSLYGVKKRYQETLGPDTYGDNAECNAAHIAAEMHINPFLR